MLEFCGSSPPNNPRRQHLVARADRDRILIRRASEALEIGTQRLEIDDLVDEAVLGAIGWARRVVILLRHFVHLVGDRLQRLAQVLILDGAAAVGWLRPGLR